MGLIDEVKARTREMKVPIVSSSMAQVLLGVVNCLFFGFGVIIAGIMNNSLPDVVIGLLQLFVPVLGWMWAIFWGVLMISRNGQGSDEYGEII